MSVVRQQSAPTLAELCSVLARQLQAEDMMVATAESCTGGMIAAALTDIAGSSSWFERGFVTYSNEAKQDLLAVTPATLRVHGAVSEASAAEMAVGALRASRAGIALSVTGIAGPGGGSADKPVGTVCFGWALDGIGVATETMHFEGDRAAVRLSAASYALARAIEFVDALRHQAPELGRSADPND